MKNNIRDGVQQHNVKPMKRRSSRSEHPQRVGVAESPMISWTVNGPLREW